MDALTSGHDLPMIEHTLGERLPTSSLPQVSVEAERLVDGQVRLDREHRSSHPLFLAEDLSATLVQAAVNASDGVLRTLDLDWRNIGSGDAFIGNYTHRDKSALEG